MNERDMERTAAVVGKLVAASARMDDQATVAQALSTAVLEMRALLQQQREDQKNFIITIAALALQNGGKVEIEMLSIVNVSPSDSLERTCDSRTGNIVYTLVKG